MTRYVQRVTDRRSGQSYLYLRRKGWPRVQLHAAWGTAELEAEVEAQLKALAPQKVEARTLREALRVYELQNPDFRALAEETRYNELLLLKEFDADLGAVRIEKFTGAYVYQLRNLWAARGHRAAAARLLLLKKVLTPAMIAGRIVDPFAHIPPVKRPADLEEPHRLWPMWVVETVMDAAIERERYGLARAIAIGRFAGPRRADICRLLRNARRGGRLAFLSGKKKVPVDQPEDPRLTTFLDRTPAAQPDEARRGRKVKAGQARPLTTTLVYNLVGRPYTEDGLARELAKLLKDLKGRGLIDTADYGFHGLRHTRGVEAALGGCTDAEGAALLGHASPHSFATYRRQAERLRLADNAAEKIAALQERTRNPLVKNDMENRCKTPKPGEPARNRRTVT